MWLNGIFMETMTHPASTLKPPPATRPHRIVVVGGGAGGLELLTRLGDQLGKQGQAQIILVDSAATHLWKPLLHEVAAGSMDPNTHHSSTLPRRAGIILNFSKVRCLTWIVSTASLSSARF